MKILRNRSGWVYRDLSVGLLVMGLLLARNLFAADSGDLVPLTLKLPAPAFKGTPKDIQLSSFVEPLSEKPRPPMMVPAGLKNIAKDAKITCSDKNATAESLAKIVDGDK
jgi:hypothetical protein